MVHDVFGDISKAADTLVLYGTVRGECVCTVNVCHWLTGSHGDEARRGMAGTNHAVD